MPKKLYVQITPFFPDPDNFRGPYVYDQVRALERNGEFQVIVFKPYRWPFKEVDYEYNGVQVYRFPFFQLPSNIFPGIFDKLSFYAFYKKLDSLGVDIDDISVVHSHVTGTAFIANELKKKNGFIKTILQHHGFDVLSLTNGILRNVQWHRNVVRKYGVKICNRIDLHVGVSNKTLSKLQEYSDINIKDSYVLYNGVDSQKFFPTNNKNINKCFVIGCIGNFWPLKDQITLIKAVEILINRGIKNVKVKFIGSGATFEKCLHYINKKNIKAYFEFISEIDHSLLNTFYNSLDLFILPSYDEAFGCVYTEAFACNVPFIAVEEQGIAELIPEHDKKKWLIKKGDYQNLAELIFQNKRSMKVQNLMHPVEIDFHVNKFLDFLKSFSSNA